VRSVVGGEGELGVEISLEVLDLSDVGEESSVDLDLSGLLGELLGSFLFLLFGGELYLQRKTNYEINDEIVRESEKLSCL